MGIITTDITRACPDKDLLPYILKETQNAKDVKIVAALGLHPPMNMEEIIEKIGSAVVDRYKIINHKIY